jgi:ubiquitin carboxyl-terminal hydrolase 5/13
MFSGQYSPEKTTTEYEVDKEPKIIKYQDGIKPQAFKTFFGKGHPEFKTGRQQDALEYLNHFLD